MLLTRDQFRDAVIDRDQDCVMCCMEGQDAHHIIERRLFPDGGYYLDNGALLCGDCHMEAEMTLISCEEIRSHAGIQRVVLPPHLYDDVRYDKWGNPILPNGQRLRGDLFEDESVQKILAAGKVLNEFTEYVKYPRTYHLPWSPGVGKDDRVLEDLSGLELEEVVVTGKMDGENTTMYRDYIHARSLDSRHHPSRAWVKQLHSKICHDIPKGWRVCGENLYAKHSIHYKDLLDYFLVFSIWNVKNVCLDWWETSEWIQLLGLQRVPLLYKGIFDQQAIHKAFMDWQGVYGEQEGYVVRVYDPFHYSKFNHKVGKFVRQNHVQTHGHWMREKMETNQLYDWYQKA